MTGTGTTATLEQVLADARGDAQRLRTHGHAAQANSLEGLADAVSDAMRPYLTMLSESEASLRSGWSGGRLRSRFAEWEAQGLAMLDPRGKRRYRQIIVPARLEHAAAKLAGMRGDSLRGAS